MRTEFDRCGTGPGLLKMCGWFVSLVSWVPVVYRLRDRMSHMPSICGGLQPSRHGRAPREKPSGSQGLPLGGRLLYGRGEREIIKPRSIRFALATRRKRMKTGGCKINFLCTSSIHWTLHPQYSNTVVILKHKKILIGFRRSKYYAIEWYS